MKTFTNAAVLFTFFSLATSTCYWPPGNATYDRDLTEHQPCSNDTTSPLSTICCALNRTNPSGGDQTNGRTNDVCLPNGVCENRVLVHGTMQVSYWRETCTSKDWKTGLCLDVCDDDWTSGNGTTGAVMTPCDGTEHSLKWCCGVDTSCCNDDSKVKTLPFEFRGTLPNTASASNNPFTTSTSTSTATSTVSPDRGLSTGAKAGIGIGAAIGGLALIGVGFFIARRGRAAHKQRTAPDTQMPMSPYAPSPYGQNPQEKMQYAQVGEPSPMQQDMGTYEADSRTRVELPYSVPAGTKPGHSYEMM